jgi:hypothetical protein
VAESFIRVISPARSPKLRIDFLPKSITALTGHAPDGREPSPIFARGQNKAELDYASFVQSAPLNCNRPQHSNSNSVLDMP